MKESTNEFIKELTKQDKKTLTQKALKVCEEAGELAKWTLPFEDASGTLHRFSDKQRILEEVADVYLTAISVAYDLGFTNDDFEDMVDFKMKKWADIQQNESKVQGKTPYEIHVTVEVAEVTTFKEHCRGLDVKPIVLALQTESGLINDVMTSSVHMGSNRSAYDEMKRISDGLRTFGYTVVREKIETVPWHPAAPKRVEDDMPKGCYFETHVGVNVPDEKRLETLKKIAKTQGAHMSRNAFKTHEDGSWMQMVTLREYHGWDTWFEQVAKRLESEIRKQRFEIEKRITEFSIYDTKVSHDAAWLTGEEK